MISIGISKYEAVRSFCDFSVGLRMREKYEKACLSAKFGRFLPIEMYKQRLSIPNM